MDGEQDAGSLSLSSPSAPAKLSAKWATLLHLTTTDAATEEGIKALAETYGRIFEDKDALVQTLTADAKASEQEMQAAHEAHGRQRDSLLAFHRAHTATLEQGFTRDLEALQKEFQTEAALLAKQHAEEQAELRQLLQSIEAYEQGKEQERQELQARVRDILKQQGQEQIAKLRQGLTAQIDMLVQHLQDKAPTFATAATGTTTTMTSSSSSSATTTAAETEVKTMATKDQSLTAQIEAKVCRIDQELQRWKEWRVKMTTSGKEHSDRNQALFNEKRALLDQYRKLKLHMNKYRQEQQDALEALDEEADGAQEGLNAQIELGLRVLHLAEWAHKKEVEQDGALDRLQCSLIEDSPLPPPGSDSSNNDSGNENGEGVSAQEAEPLNTFWRRYNQSLLGKVAFQERRDALLEENRMLQLTIQQYLDGVTVNDDILSRSNPLLVVKAEAKTPPRPPRRNDSSSSSGSPPRNRHPPCVIEGNHMLQTGRLSTGPFFA